MPKDVRPPNFIRDVQGMQRDIRRLLERSQAVQPSSAVVIPIEADEYVIGALSGVVTTVPDDGQHIGGAVLGLPNFVPQPTPPPLGSDLYVDIYADIY